MNKFLKVLAQEVVPAQGCTEPIAVAFAVSVAAEQIDGDAQKIELLVSGNILKNALGVGIPGTGRIGIDIAALLGAVIKNSSKKLEILCDLSAEQLAAAEALLAQKILTVALKKDTTEKLYIEAIVTSGAQVGRCIVTKEHTNIALIEKNGKIVFEKPQTTTGGNDGHEELSIAEIYNYAITAPFEEIKFILDGARMNKAVSDEGLRGDYGLRVGKALRGQLNGDILKNSTANEIVSAACAASDARMDGCAMPIMTTAGSGNHGISATLPAIALAEKLGKTEEELARAIIISDLISIHIKSFMGRLSPLCGAAIAGGTGSACAMIYLMGGGLSEMNLAINSMLSNHTGMICDGAKTTCALKIATGTQAAVLCATLAMNGIAPSEKDGIICRDPEDTIRSVGKLVSIGMPNLDPTILDLMLDK